MDTSIWDDVDRYFAGQLVPTDPILEEALRASTEAGLPAINVTPVQGKFLHLLARLQGARRILEVGTLGGYSTLWLARALPAGGSLVTLELDPACAAVARANFQRAGLADRIDLRVGPASHGLASLLAEGGPPFDLVFLDADKQHHADYLEAALPLTRPGTLIIADNVVRDGEVVNLRSEDPNVLGIRKLITLLATDPRLDATALQTVGSKGYDGFALALVNPPPPAPSPPPPGGPSSTPPGS